MKDNKHRYCLRPFTNLEITSYEFASCCCGAWLPDFNAGDIEKQTLNEIWNSSPMQRIRKSILDGSYNFCNKVSCPYLNSELFKLYTKDELQSVLEAYEKGTDLEPSLCSIKKYAPWISNILDNNTYLDVLPANYNLCYDETCNLKCPSCRKLNIVFNHGEEYLRRLKIHKKVFNEIEKRGYEYVRRLQVTGSGDPFCSTIFQDLLFNFDARKYPMLSFFIMTNGLLLTPEVWEKMSKIHSNIENIFISIDAATSGTYQKIRVNGNFEKLCENIRFLGQKRLEGKLKYLQAALVVQKKNYKEMADFVKLVKSCNFDQAYFSTLDNWESWDEDVYLDNAVCNETHPEYPELLEVLKNPIFDDPIVNLSNVTVHRSRALGRFVS